ncbi:recombinase family protein [Paracoccus sp. S-4012]|uniref:recombinase family protein n=1 Tax=Paracoccus sp. S-4012 TaxID=2665648 RepID=UPI001E5CA308|nr:recombinase family protein [Paracoccus sp. S-4012]
MRFLDVQIVTKAEGEINEMHIGLGGTMSALFLKNLAQKTHRGLEGRVRDGKSAGGISYGYRALRTLRADGTLTRGLREIIPAEADVIRRIFADYAAGLSARSIAAALNAEGIRSPENGKGAGTWGPSTISGNAARGTGILNNELHVGRLVWNRQRFVKDPASGKRQARLNPPEAWIIEEVPDLRIIEDALWRRVKERQTLIRHDMNPAGIQGAAMRPERAKRPVYLFSGLLTCGCCGAGYTLINKARHGCAAARDKGASVCTNRATIRREEVEARVLEGLKARLLHPDLVAAFVEEYRRAWNKAQAGASAGRTRAQRELVQAEKKIAGLLQAIEDGMYHPSMKAKMQDLETTRTRLLDELAENPEPPALRLHPSLTELYREKITDLAAALSDPAVKLQAIETLRSLISEIRMIPDALAPGGHRIELVGELAAILALEGADMTKPSRMARAGSGTVVAGTRVASVMIRQEKLARTRATETCCRAGGSTGFRPLTPAPTTWTPPLTFRTSGRGRKKPRSSGVAGGGRVVLPAEVSAS